MIVRNWMTRDPMIVSSDTLVTDVERLLYENNLRAVPVVDDGRLRGLISRAISLRAVEYASRTQDQHEINYFVTRLKVKDLMVRNPVTVDIGDTMEYCLQTGQDTGVSQFPVLDNGKVVGIVSASEIFHLAARMLGAWHDWSGITLAPRPLEKGTIGKIASIVEATGANVHSLFSIRDTETPSAGHRVIIRFQDAPLMQVVENLKTAGFEIFEAYEKRRGSGDGAVH